MSDSEVGLLHHNYDKRNQILYWSGTDQQDRFNNNCRNLETREKLERLGWLEPDCITYNYNSFGFRDVEFDDRPCGIALGCSHTEGTGLPETATWPRVLSKLIGTHIWNLGVGGSSIDTAFRLLDHWLLKLKPKFVLFCMPDEGRVEVFDRGNPASLVPQHQPTHLEYYYKIWATDESNAQIQKRKNLLAMQYLCDQANVPFYYVNWTELGTNNPTKYQPGGARDLMHCSSELHEIFGHKMYNLLTLGEHDANS